MPSELGRNTIACGVTWLWICLKPQTVENSWKPAVFSTGFYSLFFFNIPGLLFWADLCFSEMKNFIIKSYKNPAYMNWNINVIVVSRIDIDGMETSTGTVDDLQPLTLLHCKVNQDRPVWQVCKRLVQGERTINSRAHLGSGINASS